MFCVCPVKNKIPVGHYTELVHDYKCTAYTIRDDLPSWGGGSVAVCVGRTKGHRCGCMMTVKSKERRFV